MMRTPATDAIAARAEAAATATASSNSTGGPLDPNALVEAAEEHWNVSGQSVLIAWILTAVACLCICLLFSYARRRATNPKSTTFRMMYMPRVEACAKKLRDAESKDGEWIAPVPEVHTGFFAWLRPLWDDLKLEVRFWNTESVWERDLYLLNLLGLDAVSYVQFLRLLRWLFTSITILVAIPLSCALYYINTYSEYGSPSGTTTSPSANATAQLHKRVEASNSASNSTSLLDNMQVFTAANVVSTGLYVNIAFEIIVTALVVLFVTTHCRHHKSLVEEWILMNKNEISFKSIMVTNFSIGPTESYTDLDGKTRQRELRVLDAKLDVVDMLRVPHDMDFTVTLTHRDMAEIAKRITKFKETYFPRFDRTIHVFMRRLQKPVYKHVWGRLCSQEVTIEHAIDKALAEKQKIQQEQAEARDTPETDATKPLTRAVTSAFVVLPTAKDASEVIKNCSKRKVFREAGIDIRRAPRSKNVLWNNLEKDPGQRRRARHLGTAALVVLCFLNTIPLLFITLVANLDTFAERVPFLKNLKDSSQVWEFLFTVIAGVVPAAISALFAYALPYAMRYLDKLSGAMTRSQLDKNVIRRLFVFLLFSNFVMFSLLGIIYDTYLTVAEKWSSSTWTDIWLSLGDVPAKVTKAYITESSYWLSWFPIHATLVCLQLLQLPRWALKIYQILSEGETSNQLNELSQPRNFEYCIEYSHILFAMVIALVYAPLAPLVPICGCLYFWTISVVHLEQLKYVENTKETDGRCWRVVINRLLVATVIMQLLCVLTVTLKTMSTGPVICSLLPIPSVLFLKIYVRRFKDTNEIIADMSVRARSRREKVPVYEHELLRHDWMPDFLIVPHVDGPAFGEAVRNKRFGKALRKLVFGSATLPAREKGDDTEKGGHKKRKKTRRKHSR